MSHSLSTDSSQEIISLLYNHVSNCKQRAKRAPVYEAIDFTHFDPPNYHYITDSIQRYISSLKKIGRIYKLYFTGGRVIKLYIILPYNKRVYNRPYTSLYSSNKTYRVKTTEGFPLYSRKRPNPTFRIGYAHPKVRSKRGVTGGEAPNGGAPMKIKTTGRNKTLKMDSPRHHTPPNEVYNRVFDAVSTILSLFIKENGHNGEESILPFPNCSTELSIYLYLTDLKKTLPTDTNLDRELKEENVNTGFTFGCSLKNQVFIYREEEWEKVLIHELIHAFGLDFASNNHLNAFANQRAMEFFGIKKSGGFLLYSGERPKGVRRNIGNKDLRLYEAYTETWADVLYTLLKTPRLKLALGRLRLQQEWAIHQYVKILSFYGIEIGSSSRTESFKEAERELILKESVTLYSYYILKSRILYNLGHFFDFMRKSKDTNTFLSIVEFDKTEKGVGDFMDFILNDLYKKDEGFEKAVVLSHRHSKNKKNKYTNSLRMTI